MIRHQLRCGSLIRQDARKWQLPPPVTEIHRRQVRFADELRKVISRGEPCQDAVPLPSPRDGFLTGGVRAQVPSGLQRILGNPAMNLFLIPSEYKQNAFFRGHRLTIAACMFVASLSGQAAQFWLFEISLSQNPKDDLNTKVLRRVPVDTHVDLQ